MAACGALALAAQTPGTAPSLPGPLPRTLPETLEARATKGEDQTRAFQAWQELSGKLSDLVGPRVQGLAGAGEAGQLEWLVQDLPLPGASAASGKVKLTPWYRTVVSLNLKRCAEEAGRALKSLEDKIPLLEKPAGTGPGTQVDALWAACSLNRKIARYAMVQAGLETDLGYTGGTAAQAGTRALGRFLALKTRLEALQPPLDLDLAAEALATGLVQDIRKLPQPDWGLGIPLPDSRKSAAVREELPVYVFPPAVEGSAEITPFAATIQDRISDALVTAGKSSRPNIVLAQSPAEARYQFRGHYGTNASGNIVLEYQAVHQALAEQPWRQEVIDTKGIKKQFWQPFSTLEEGVIKNEAPQPSELVIELSTSRGKRDLLVTSTQTVTLLARANKPVRLWILDHMLYPTGAQTTLVQQTEDLTGNPSSFLLDIGDDRTDQWVEFGSYTACPPYGLERLQALASSGENTAGSGAIELLPPFHHDPQTGLWFVGTNPVETIRHSRGMLRGYQKPATESAPAVLTAEAFLTITSRE